MTTAVQRSFTGGEIAPELQSRVDTVKYQTATRTQRNVFSAKTSGAQSRAGSLFVGEIKDSTHIGRLIPFDFGLNQTYMLEFGNLTMRVIRNGAYLSDLTLTITGITNASPGVLTYTGTDPSNGQEVYISGVLGAIGPYVNGRNFKIASINTVANTFQLAYLDGTIVNTTTWGAYGSAGTAQRIYTVTTTYAYSDLRALKFKQIADTIRITSSAHPAYKLTRSGHTSWTFTAIDFVPDTATPASLAVSGTGGIVAFWWVTAVDSVTGEEGLPQSGLTGANAVPSSGAPRTLTWSAVTGAGSYRVYRSEDGGANYGFVGEVTGTAFVDNGVTIDYSDAPPFSISFFDQAEPLSGSIFPYAIGYVQQRILWGGTSLKPTTIWASRIACFANLLKRLNAVDSDSFSFKANATKVSEIKHFVELEDPLIFASGAEFVLSTDSSGILKPDTIKPKEVTQHGCGDLAPIVINGRALFVDRTGAVVREMNFDSINGYTAPDLSNYSPHLLEGFQLVSWAYQSGPDPIIWAVRDDGVMLGITYDRKEQILAWHKHDTDGLIEDVSVVSENGEDAVYMIVKRTISSTTKRYVERMTNRRVAVMSVAQIAATTRTVPFDMLILMDGALTYNGFSTGSVTMTLTGGTAWDEDEELTLTASGSTFKSTDVNNYVYFYDTDRKVVVRLRISSYTSATVVKVFPDRTVTAGYRGVAIASTRWALADDVITGLWHLEGKAVSVFGDGTVVASPYNDDYTTITVTNGSITLPDCYAIVHVGLPFIADLETLDIDTAQGQPLADQDKLIQGVALQLVKSSGIYVGPKAPTDDDDDALEGLTKLKYPPPDGYDPVDNLFTGTVDQNFDGEWNSNGRVFLRQVDPLPMTVISIMPQGLIPYRR